jgi:putative heme degradation protein
MFVKISGDQIVKYPYTMTDLRRENPQTSFSAVVPNEILVGYEVYPVSTVAAPSIDIKTHRLESRAENIDGAWTQVWETHQLPEASATDNVRAYRAKLLSETDWTATTDNTMTTEMTSYRQALRDITSQVGFPYSVEWPVKP